MVSIYQQVPFRKDILEKALEDQLGGQPLSLQMIGRMCELLGMSSQIAAVETAFVENIECPAVTLIEGTPCVLFSIKEGYLCQSEEDLKTVSLEEFSGLFIEKIRFVLPRRLSSTPLTRFGWHWFTPLIKKYKSSLLLVFGASLLAQLFGLAIPLLIQQIIDKVLNQGNLSSLNVLGGVMIVLALFQGILMALRTFIFVDTTDRMDLTLGSSVIDRLLALPLSFFEKRQWVNCREWES